MAGAAAEELAIGTTVGDYQITGKLGAGAFGSVYAGLHPDIGKRAAIKVLHRSAAAQPEMLLRFKQEARAANEINHPNIVNIFAFGELADGRPYFVMDFLQGGTLQEMLQHGGGTLPPGQLVPILEQVADAVDAAHRAGVVHRDLKPDNIFVASSGSKQHVQVLDFGIAKLAEGALVETSLGMPMGTLPYMSPEQCFGKGIDHRTDVYAFGVIAFQGLTGRFPIEATSLAETVTMHLQNDRRKPSEFGAPPTFDAPIMQCLTGDPETRFTTVTAAWRALAHAATETGSLPARAQAVSWSPPVATAPAALHRPAPMQPSQPQPTSPIAAPMHNAPATSAPPTYAPGPTAHNPPTTPPMAAPPSTVGPKRSSKQLLPVLAICAGVLGLAGIGAVAIHADEEDDSDNAAGDEVFMYTPPSAPAAPSQPTYTPPGSSLDNTYTADCQRVIARMNECTREISGDHSSEGLPAYLCAIPESAENMAKAARCVGKSECIPFMQCVGNSM